MATTTGGSSASKAREALGAEARRVKAIAAVLALGPETANGEFPVPRVALRSRESWPWVMVLATAAEAGDHACAPDCPCWQMDGPGRESRAQDKT